MDEKYIKKNYLNKTNKELAIKFNVSIATIVRKLSKMKLSRRIKIKPKKGEVFKAIPGFSKYKVSNLGRFKKLSDNTEIKQSYTPDGYLGIKLVSDTNIRVTNRSHRLVAKVFLKNNDPINKIEINHIDGKKDNNNINNLEWISPSDNQKHAYKNNLRKPNKGIKSGLTSFTNKQIHMICKELENKNTVKNITNKFKWIKTESFVYNIKYKRRWVHISKNYNF
jgi:hypothetical protein